VAVWGRASVAALAVGVLALGISVWGGAASQGERVTITSADPKFTRPIPATVYRPQGAGPFPAVVLLHGCGGLEQWNLDWGAWLADRGYVTILPDSLAPRSLKQVCDASGLDFDEHALDALGALAYLRGQPDVIPTRVFVMGWSHGGAATLISDKKPFIEKTAPAGGPYRGAIAFYPACRVFESGGITSPLLMLLGGADDFEPPAACIKHGEELKANGARIDWTVYPNVSHAFDAGYDRTVQLSGGRTVHIASNAAATADAHTQVEQFLSERSK